MDTLAQLVPGIQLGILIGMLLVNQRLLRLVRRGLRREDVLTRGLLTYEQLLKRSVRGTLDLDELRLGVQLVETGLADELHAQQRMRWWQRIPAVGERWPDDALASVLTEDELHR